MKKTAILFSIILFIVLGVVYISAEKDFGKSIPASFPPNVPVIKGSIISSKAFRSDELKRGIEVITRTELPILQVVEFYKEAFGKTKSAQMSFSESSSETGQEVAGVGEVGPNQVVVMIKQKKEFTEVTTQVLGNSVLFLPK